jgi:hypothetical protein
MQVKLELDAQRVFRAHLGIIGALAILYVGSTAGSLLTGRDTLLGLVPLFNFDAEFNAPALFSAAALGFAGALAWLTGRLHLEQDRLSGRAWQALGVLLGFLALDEALSLHEKIGIQLDVIHMAGQNYSWLAPYVALAIIVAGTFIPFLVRLPPPTRNGLVAAGCIFVGGAAGMEFVGGQTASQFGQASVAYRLTILVEETAEMLGIALFIRTVVDHATRIQHAAQHDLLGDALRAPGEPSRVPALAGAAIPPARSGREAPSRAA